MTSQKANLGSNGNKDATTTTTTNVKRKPDILERQRISIRSLRKQMQYDGKIKMLKKELECLETCICHLQKSKGSDKTTTTTTMSLDTEFSLIILQNIVARQTKIHLVRYENKIESEREKSNKLLAGE
jgi:hypothetical protein